jgi:hypothetical protein
MIIRCDDKHSIATGVSLTGNDTNKPTDHSNSNWLEVR